MRWLLLLLQILATFWPSHAIVDTCENLPHWRAVIGSSQLSALGSEVHVRYVKQVVLHEEYQPVTEFSDIALMELDQPIKCSNFIQPACVPDSAVAVSALTHCYISGWGVAREHATVPSDLMQEAKVKRFATEKCNSSSWYDGAISEHSLCAGYEKGGTDSCQGDSGGPLMCREDPSQPFWVIGITSWGRGCARPHKPGVYTSTQHFYNWIKGWAGPMPQPPPTPATPLVQTHSTPPATTAKRPTELFHSKPPTISEPEALPEPSPKPTHPPKPSPTTTPSIQTHSRSRPMLLSWPSEDFHLKPKAPLQQKPKSEPEAPPQPEPEISQPELPEAPTQSEPEASPQPKPQPESKAPSQLESEAPPQLESEAPPQLESEAPPQSNTQLEPEAPPQPVHEAHPHLQPQPEAEAPLQPETQPDSEVPPEPEPHSTSKAPPQAKSHPKPGTGVEANSTVAAFFNLLEKFLHAIKKEKGEVWPKLTQLELTAEENVTSFQDSGHLSATNLTREANDPCQKETSGAPCGTPVPRPH